MLYDAGDGVERDLSQDGKGRAVRRHLHEVVVVRPELGDAGW